MKVINRISELAAFSQESDQNLCLKNYSGHYLQADSFPEGVKHLCLQNCETLHHIVGNFPTTLEILEIISCPNILSTAHLLFGERFNRLIIRDSDIQRVYLPIHPTLVSILSGAQLSKDCTYEIYLGYYHVTKGDLCQLHPNRGFSFSGLMPIPL